MTWFRAFRGDFGYSYYGEYRTSVTADIPFAAITYTCILISIAAIIAAAGIRGREKWYTLIRLVYSLAVGSIILVSAFGYCWQQGEVGVHTPYIYRSKGHIKGTIGVHIGLKTVNLTLKGDFYPDGSGFKYNEELALENVIRDRPQLWDALDRGLPQPLLSVIEQFDIDEGGMRYGRQCFMAGHFANILLWTAFAFWVTGNILLCSVIWYGAACFTLTGICMVLAAAVYDILCPQVDVNMPCSDGPMKMRYGWCFWSVLVFGCLTILVGLVLFTLDQKVPKKLAEFFLLDNTLDEDEYKQIQPNMSFMSSTPETTIKMGQSRKKSHIPPVNWYVNYGHDSNRRKSNPLFADNASGKGEQESQRRRSCAKIIEEHRATDTELEVTSNGVNRVSSPNGENTESKGYSAHRRLSEIYIDIEPNKSFSSASSPSLSENRLKTQL
ncbi:dual oxidase maturation factor 1-like isoform X2 [Mya arenaria]|nr:dual oxidase maturation factor 1-like isoform X2 [Mya arenaria]XP_052805251.1 dual oxidase maturation factor 1-like isoform X2 [Mya arenaria]